MMQFLQHYQLDIMLMLGAACAVVAIFVLLSTTIPLGRRKILFAIEISSMVLLFSDRLDYIYRGDPSRKAYWIVRIVNFLVYFSMLVLIERFNAYVADLATHEGGRVEIPKPLKVARILLFVEMGLVIISQFTGLYYTFDDQNRYVRSPAYIISYIIPLAAFVIQLCTIISIRHSLRKRMFIPLVLFTIMPALAAVAQILLFGLSLTTVTVVGMAILLYAFALVDMNRSAEREHAREVKMLTEERESMEDLFDETASALVGAIDAKDEYTQGHSTRVAQYSRRIAQAAGKDREECDDIYYAALLHDVGKIGIPMSIIGKKGKLTQDEYDTIKTHTVIGDNILSSIKEFPDIRVAARSHHEWYDGSGYPDGLKGEAIPDIGRVVAVADAYDAMTSTRSYRKPFTQEEVRREIENGLGSQFDPVYGKLMIELIDKDSDYTMRDLD